jgi:8-oxo-dGTP diphosphatase
MPGSPPKTPPVTVDAVVFDASGRLLLIRRGHEPFKGRYALPGGFVDIGETTEDACRRELLEETGVEAGELRLVGVYSDPGRDPRGHTVSVAYLSRIDGAEAQGGDDAVSAAWVANWRRLKLAFDHGQIVADAVGRFPEHSPAPAKRAMK